MATISFKVSEAEARVIRDSARRERVTVSDFLRRRAMGSVEGLPKPAVGRCPVTGATIFQPGDGRPPLTVAATRELLADFP